MAMRACDNCLENNWKFTVLPERWIRATCNLCGHDIEFEGKAKVFAKVSSPEEACPRCQEFQLTWKEHRPGWRPKPAQPYYFSRWLKCGECDFVQYIDEFKVIL